MLEVAFTVFYLIMCHLVTLFSDPMMLLKLKGKFYRTAIRQAMLYGAEYYPT
jgi:hypothetical protein